MATPGILMRLSNNPPPLTPLQIPNTTIEAIYTLSATDNETPASNTIYFLSDTTPLSAAHYTADKAANPSIHAWVVANFINGRSSSEPNNETTSPFTQPHVLPSAPIKGTVLVVNGSTPGSSEAVADYHNWYDREHGGKLARVPGWIEGRRYAFAKAYGDIETASFYGLNFYEEVNGLGGPEWQAGVTEWTMRVRKNAAKANIRRMWRVEETI
ncbi:hypothetical protein BJX99DRAFT_259672 [Aspergillus californicus]